MTPVNRPYSKDEMAKTIVSRLQCIVEMVKKRDPELAKEIAKDVYLSGGAITSMLQGTHPQDFDFFFRSQEVALKTARFFMDTYFNTPYIATKGEHGVNLSIKTGKVTSKNAKAEMRHEQGYLNENVPSCITRNAISLGDAQLILAHVGEPKEMVAHMDFIHCTNYYVISDGTWGFTNDALISIITKTLKPQSLKTPVNTIFRLHKFLKRGWTIEHEDLLRITLAIYQKGAINGFSEDGMAVLYDSIQGMYGVQDLSSDAILDMLDDLR